MDEAITLLIELLFALVFVAAAWTAWRRRDPLALDVTLVFSGLSLLFVVDLLRRMDRPVPAFVASLGVVLLLAQPTFTLRLAGHVRELPRWLLPVASVATLVTAVPLVVIGGGVPVIGILAAVGVFVVLEALAAVYLALEARVRRGSARIRLAIAASATAAFALAILAAGGGVGSGTSQGSVANLLARLLALAAGLGFVIAFLPPAVLRRTWQSVTGFGYTSYLFGLPVTAPTPDIWARFADVVRTITGGAVYVIAGDDGEGQVAAVAGGHGPIVESFPARAFDRLIASADEPSQPRDVAANPIRSLLLGREGGRQAVVVPVPLAGRGRAAVVAVTARVALFGADDAALLRSLAARVGVLIDRRVVLSEQERLTAELAETVESLRAASQAKSDFLASMSHELRTPLNAIIGFSELLREQAGEEQTETIAAPVEWLEHMHRGGQHLLALINDVLDLSKVEAGRLELASEPVDLAVAVRESLAGLRPLADRKHLRLESSVGSLVIEADRGRLRQILYNLLSNAIKYTPDGGRIAVEADADDVWVRLSVVDTGVGIAVDDQPFVFEEFRQVGDIAARQPGTGLGLALTRRLVEAHGGRIDLTSTVGEGSRFTIALPRPNAVLETPPEIVTTSGPRHGERAGILVIEDDPSAARLLRTYLETAGYTVRMATTGEAGLSEARRELPAAIVLDVLLPTIDGWDVLRLLKGDERLRDVPVVIVTVIDERDVGLALGATDYLLKPVSRDALLSRLDRYTFTTKVRERVVTVLAIDDEAAGLDLVRAVLVPEGFVVTLAASGDAGLELAQRELFDLIICDLLMPGLDGFEVVAALKSDTRTSGIPILILTSHQVSQAEKAALNGKILGIVEKGEHASEGLRAWLRRAAPTSARAEDALRDPSGSESL